MVYSGRHYDLERAFTQFSRTRPDPGRDPERQRRRAAERPAAEGEDTPADVFLTVDAGNQVTSGRVCSPGRLPGARRRCPGRPARPGRPRIARLNRRLQTESTAPRSGCSPVSFRPGRHLRSPRRPEVAGPRACDANSSAPRPRREHDR
ncbi:hypothetical protein HBB16_16165 [Pseudonocardia sp. MCCB 268]|nr:hypothetical protein [Pseudonocardia cytotoxica]